LGNGKRPAKSTPLGRSRIFSTETPAAIRSSTSTVQVGDLVAAGVPVERIRLRPNGVDFAGLFPLPDRGPFRARLGIPAEAPLLLTIARIGAIKGLESLARAIGPLSNAWWLLAGPDQHDGTLEQVRAALAAVGAVDRVIVLEHGLWGDEKRSALAEADAFCLPSTYESFGTAAIEAAGLGAPVVITDGCGAKDVLHGPSTFVVPASDASALSQGIRDAFNQTARDAAVARATALRKELDWSTVAATQAEVYAEIVAAS